MTNLFESCLVDPAHSILYGLVINVLNLFRNRVLTTEQRVQLDQRCLSYEWPRGCPRVTFNIGSSTYKRWTMTTYKLIGLILPVLFFNMIETSDFFIIIGVYNIVRFYSASTYTSAGLEDAQANARKTLLALLKRFPKDGSSTFNVKLPTLHSVMEYFEHDVPIFGHRAGDCLTEEHKHQTLKSDLPKVFRGDVSKSCMQFENDRCSFRYAIEGGQWSQSGPNGSVVFGQSDGDHSRLLCMRSNAISYFTENPLGIAISSRLCAYPLSDPENHQAEPASLRLRFHREGINSTSNILHQLNRVDYAALKRFIANHSIAANKNVTVLDGFYSNTAQSFVRTGDIVFMGKDFLCKISRMFLHTPSTGNAEVILGVTWLVPVTPKRWTRLTFKLNVGEEKEWQSALSVTGIAHIDHVCSKTGNCQIITDEDSELQWVHDIYPNVYTLSDLRKNKHFCEF